MIARAIIIVVLSSRVVAAQPSPAADAADAAYRAARRHYDLREWDAAIAKFREAYRLAPEPSALFNIAQAYRQKGDCAEALGTYRTYKRNFPTASNIATVDKHIAALDPCPPPSPVTQPPALAPVPVAPPTPGRTQRIVGLAVAGTGVVIVATGTLFGLRARSLAHDVEDGDGVWDPDVEARGERADLTAKILWTIGGAAIVGGGVTYWLGRRSTGSTVGLVPRAGGGMLVWRLDR